MKKLFFAFILCASLLPGAVVQANTIDLINANTGIGSAEIGGAYIGTWVDQHSTGTGVIDPFLRIQDSGNEQGYNANNYPGPGQIYVLDSKIGLHTHALELSTVPIVSIGGVAYREFLLDINETATPPSSYLSLNQIQIFMTGSEPVGGRAFSFLSPASTTQDPLIAFSSATEIFRMNNIYSLDRDVINLDFDRNPGSGWGDMFLYVRNDAFTGSGDWLIFYSQFGSPRGFDTSSDGFEEWAVRTPGTAVPEPATLLLFGLGLVGLAGIRRMRQ